MLDNDPLWYKDAIIYEVHVRAFHDAATDGMGDFRGLTQKLDYLEDLGITAIWLLPFYPSPLRDDGYDIASYTDVHPHYGRLADFKQFLDEAHRRGLRVITELVVNHTSDQHLWFQRARRAPAGSVERNFYVWSDTPDRYKGARIIFKDFELSNWSWDPVARAYYWHRFYHHQPDLNFDNPAVWQAIFPVLDFWLKMGVDGMRLDAIPYLYEREGTNCENLPETHTFLKALRKHVDLNFQGRMFLAEANQWPEDAVAYFGQGDECHMAFHFPVMPRLFMALHQEDRFPILDIIAQTPPIPPTCQWCMFLRNHDELTLEMVTDEERDYMYRAYAEDRSARINLGIRRRLAPLLNNDRRRIELMNALLFSLPGTPVIYYGDEIGMGDNIYLGDRNGVRTPMQWSGDRNAGFSRANPQRLYLPVIIDPLYHYESVNVEAQQNNPSSLLWWMKRLIALRKRYRAFGRGSIEFLEPANRKVLAFIRSHGDERLLVVANLSRFVQHVELDLSRWAGLMPEELFGRSLFPVISDHPYPLTLGPHSFYWFSLCGPRPTHLIYPTESDLPVLPVPGGLDALFSNSSRDRLENLLPPFMEQRRPGGPLPISAVHIQEVHPFEYDSQRAWLLVLKVEMRSSLPERILQSLTVVSADRVSELLEPLGAAALARLQGEPESYLVDALAVPDYCHAILDLARGRSYTLTDSSELTGVPLPELTELASPEERAQLAPRLNRSDRNTYTIEYGNRVVLKTFRRMEEGINPDLEISKYFVESHPSAPLAPLVGHIELRRPEGEPMVLAVLHRHMPREDNAWQYTLDQLASFFESVAALSPEQATAPLGLDGAASKALLPELMAGYPGMARLLGYRTADLHRALAEATDPALAPEPMSRLYQRSLYQSMRTLAGQLCARLTERMDEFPVKVRDLACRVVRHQSTMLDRFHAVLDESLAGQRIRCHGDYHLGRLLYTGNNFVLIDFTGDPTRPLGERRLKRSPLRDVACMIRSLEYAVGSVLHGLATAKGRPPGLIREEDRAVLSAWGAAWHAQVTREFVSAYVEQVESTGLLPTALTATRTLLELFLLEKALLEIDADMTYRPDWMIIPLQALVRQLEGNPVTTLT